MLDIQTRTCKDTNEDLLNILVDPHVVNMTSSKFNKTSIATSFEFPTCEPGDQLVVLKPFNGDNSEYRVIHSGTAEFGLQRVCTQDGFSASSKSYCFDRGFNQDQEHESTVAVICGQPGCEACRSGHNDNGNYNCIRTCCPETHYLSGGKCTKYTNQPENWTTDFTKGKVPNATFFANEPCLSGYFQNETDHDWSFESDGSLYLDLAYYTYDQYCLNNLEDSQSGTYTKQVFACDQGDLGRCHGPYKSWLCSIDLTLVPILMGISLFFLVILQWIIWSEKKDKLYECMQLCSIWMLALVYLTLIILKVTKLTNGAMCEFLGTLFHFAYMSAFCWLSAMSHFVYTAFKSLEGRARNMIKKRYGFLDRRFGFYALYGFGCPALVSLVTIILHNVPSNDGFIAPRINDGKCTLGESGIGLDIPQLWYFHIINILNLVGSINSNSSFSMILVLMFRF